MDLLEIGTNLLKAQLGGRGDTSQITSALSDLFKSGSKDFDIATIVTKMMGNNALAGLATSWLGDGANKEIEPHQVQEIFGENKISNFSEKLGIDKGTALESLSKVIPQMVDKGSSGGSVLDSLGGLGGAAGMLNKLF